MKYFEVEQNYSKNIGMTHTFNNIMDTLKLIEPNLKTLKLSEGFFRFRGDLISSSIEGQIYWTNDINSDLSEYVTAKPYDFFKTNNDEFWVTGSNLSDILVGNSIPQLIWSPLSEEQGRDYADKLLSAYDSSVIKHGPMMPKGIPTAILILDMLIPLAAETPNYLKGIQSKWNEERKDKPELFILTGERSTNS